MDNRTAVPFNRFSSFKTIKPDLFCPRFRRPKTASFNLSDSAVETGGPESPGAGTCFITICEAI